MSEPGHNSKSVARLGFTTEPGHLYAAYSHDRAWIKVGFSTRLPDRLKAINYDYYGSPFTFIGATPSVYRAEQQIHRALRPFLQRKSCHGREIYPNVPSLEKVVKSIVEGNSRPAFEIENLFDLMDWCRTAARHPTNRDPALVAFQQVVEWRAARRAELLARSAA